MTKEEILDALRAVKYPPYDRDIVAFGMVKYVKVDGTYAEVRLYTGTNDDLGKKIAMEASALLHSKFKGCRFDVVKLESDPAKNPAPKPSAETLSGVKYKIAVASGKGGVGKSTVAVNLARAFARLFSKNGARVGLMDCDIHGPSATILMGKKSFPSVDENSRIVPPEADGIKAISMGMLVDDSQPLLWRGPMVTGAIKQFAEEVAWGELDAMVLDLPPGTGDAVLSVVQTIPLSGALIVTTPSDLASVTAVRGAMIFKKSDVEILGVVDNMAYLEMPDGSKNRIFGEGAALAAAQKLGVELIATVPIDKTLHTNRISKASEEIFDALAERIVEKLSQK